MWSDDLYYSVTSFPRLTSFAFLFTNITLKRKAVITFDDTDCFRSDSSKYKHDKNIIINQLQTLKTNEANSLSLASNHNDFNRQCHALWTSNSMLLISY